MGLKLLVSLILMEQQEQMVADNPETVFIIAHFGSWAENLKEVARWMDTYPNFNVDIAERIAELGRQPYSSRRFFEKDVYKRQALCRLHGNRNITDQRDRDHFFLRRIPQCQFLRCSPVRRPHRNYSGLRVKRRNLIDLSLIHI